MKKRLLLTSLLCVVLMVPAMFHKHSLETSKQQVEFMIDYSQILSFKENFETEEEKAPELLAYLKEMGINSIGIPFNTFEQMKNRGMISYMSGMEMQSNLVGSELADRVDAKAQYIAVHDISVNSYLEEIIDSTFDEYNKKQFGSQTVYEIYGYSKFQLSLLQFPVLPKDLKLITDFDFKIVALTTNVKEESDPIILEQIENWNEKGILSKVMFLGTEVTGYPDRMDKFYPTWEKTGIVYTETYSAEHRQKGMTTVLKEIDYNGVRGHQVPSDIFINASVNSLHERIVKAVEERNNRLVQIGLSYDKESEKTIKKLEEVISKSTNTLSEKGYTFGTSDRFEETESIAVVIAKLSFLLLCANLFALLLSYLFSKKWSIIGWTVAIVGLVMSYFLLSSLLWVALPFGFALLYPTTIGVAIWKNGNPYSTSIVKTGLLFVGISFMTVLAALSLTSIHASIPYILYVEQFRGVGLAHLVPIVLVFGLMLFMQRSLTLSSTVSLLKQPIRIYHLLIGGLLLVLGVFYLTRTGNSGLVLPFEAEFRSFLQNAFEYRPRTKEFLLAHPLMLVILFYWNRTRIMKWLLPFAIIGQLSIINTFTHLHTPLAISLTRSLLGIVLGLVIGLVLIGLIQLFISGWRKYRNRNRTIQ